MKIYDITASISENLPVYSGERPQVIDVMKMENGDECNFSAIKFSSHTGTHCDVPYHFIQDGKNLDEICLKHFYGKAKLFRPKITSHIRIRDIEHIKNIREGDIVLFDTGQSDDMENPVFNKDYYSFTPEVAEYLAARKVKTIGIDVLSIDPYKAEGFPAHKILLGKGICLLEGLVLKGVPEGEYTLSALPLKFKGGNGSPVRAVLVREYKPYSHTIDEL